MIIIGITMAAAGTEKSFLSFCGKLVINGMLTLLLRKQANFASVPAVCTIVEMSKLGECFLNDKENSLYYI